jgi:phage terminase large subunit-like protein
MLSPAQIFSALSEEEQEEFLGRLSNKAKEALKYDWNFWARPNQLEPEGDWTTWLILSGRGFGKTRTGAETIRKWVCGDTPLSRGRCWPYRISR